MKSFRPFLFSLYLFPALTLAQVEERKKEATPRQEQGRIEFNRKFSDLPAADQKDYLKALQDAGIFFRQQRILETIDKVKNAQTILKDGPDALNLLGACYVKFRDFDSARVYFRRTVELSPNSTSTRFNLCEIEFVTGNWKECIKQADIVLEKLPKAAMAMRSLVLYKKLLSYTKLNKMDDVGKIADAYTDKDDTPYAYYVEAALAFNADKALKANRALKKARQIFRHNPKTIALWDNTLNESGVK